MHKQDGAHLLLLLLVVVARTRSASGLGPCTSHGICEPTALNWFMSTLPVLSTLLELFCVTGLLFNRRGLAVCNVQIPCKPHAPPALALLCRRSRSETKKMRPRPSKLCTGLQLRHCAQLLRESAAKSTF
jgi:hypothetical protein